MQHSQIRVRYRSRVRRRLSLPDCKKASGGEAATFCGVLEDDFALISGEPKAFHYIAQSGKGLARNFCPKCGAGVFGSNLESFPGMIFVTTQT
jgi:hypothetical protein